MTELDDLIDSFLLDDLEHHLIEGSGLPGPRANLGLAARFARAAAARPSPALSSRIDEWLEISVQVAPTGDPREFLPFCALQALGSAYAPTNAERTRRLLRAAANDERWRIREAVTLALQSIGESDPAALRVLLDQWRHDDANWYEQRAIITALAHPPFLDADLAKWALEIAAECAQSIQHAGSAERRTTAFKALRQGLGFAPSLFIAKCPDPGFSLLERWIATGDSDLLWIARENLKKQRLARSYPADVGRLARLLET
jgi:hypothetical protein